MGLAPPGGSFDIKLNTMADPVSSDVSSTRSRRQWGIQDGPKGTLRKLRSQLAEDGCDASQVSIAKHLLMESQDGGHGEWKRCTTQAVHWLTKASKNGNPEAADLLNRCLKSGAGITQQNSGEVKTCVNMSEEELALRSAARKLFVSLTPFGQEFVTTRQLRTTISTDQSEPFESTASTKSDSCDTTDSAFLKWYQESSIFDVQLDEDTLVEIAGRVGQGELPMNVSLIDDQTDAADTCNRKSNPIFHKLLDWIPLAFTVVSKKATTTIAEHGDAFLTRLVPLTELRTVVVVLLCGLLPLATLLAVLPVLAFYVALIVMVVTSVQMINDMRQHCLFTTWIKVFRAVDDSTLDDSTAGHLETKFRRHRLKPYFRFLGAALSLVCLHPFCTTEAIFASDLFMLCAFFFIATVIVLNVRPYTWHVWTFLVMTLLGTLARLFGHEASLYVSHLSGIERIQTQLLGDAIVIQVGLDVIPVFGTMSVFVLMAFHHQSGSSGLYRLLLPNLVSLTWIHMTTLFFADATWAGIVRSAFIHVGFLALPMAAAVGLPFFFFATIWQSGYLLTTLMAIFVIFFNSFVKYVAELSGKLGASTSGGRWRKKLVIGVQILFGIFAILQFVPDFRDLVALDIGRATKSLDWKVYSDLCYEPTSSGSRISTVEMQSNCHRLSKLKVNWKGHVKSVKIVEINNRLEELVRRLPSVLAGKLRCAFGAYYDCDDAENPENHLSKVCALVKSISEPSTDRRCHLTDYNTYAFELEVNMMSEAIYWSTAEVALMADHTFKNFVFRLLPGDLVDFEGIIETPVRAIGHRPSIRITAIRCIDCVHHMEDAKELSPTDLRKECLKLIGFVFNFIFFPYAELRSDTFEKDLSN